jgi:hypothetical protein
MDAFNKVLVKIYQITGGKDTVDVDLADLLKKEGFFPSLGEIKSHMCAESWITETSTPNVVRMTHWGVGAAKKAGTSAPGGSRMIEREANVLLSESRELGVVIEEFRSEPSLERLKAIENKFSKIQASTAKLKELI